MTTVARPTSRQDSHWYYTDGKPCYELPKKDGSGMKVPTLADAKKLHLLPSVTTILKTLAKPELQNWIVEQAVLAVLTSPRNKDEAIDAYVERILHTEKVQEAEAASARETGIAVHDAMEGYFQGQGVAPEMEAFVRPAANALKPYGELVATEKIIVGPGYAGKADLILTLPECWWIFDFKAVKTLPPKAAWREHVLQCAGYAQGWQHMMNDQTQPEPSKPTRTGNMYISRTEPGKFVIHEHEPWQAASVAFDHLVAYWQYANSYIP